MEVREGKGREGKWYLVVGIYWWLLPPIPREPVTRGCGGSEGREGKWYLVVGIYWWLLPPIPREPVTRGCGGSEGREGKGSGTW